MPRPRMCRRVCFNPQITYFKPQGVPMRDLKIIKIIPEELEAYRLSYINNLDQRLAAQEMQISTSTYQRIIYSAHRKIAEALIKGRAIEIVSN